MPVIVICVPAVPVPGVMLLICGAGILNTSVEVLVTPPLVIATTPLVAVAGTVAVTSVSDQFTTVPTTLLNFTVLLPCVAPNPLPLICTWVDIGPEVGENEATKGLGMVNTVSWLLGTLPVNMTMTGPVLAFAGTVATICVSLQLTMLALFPLNLTALDAWVEWNAVPVIVTCVPTIPLVGWMLVIAGVGTVK